MAELLFNTLKAIHITLALGSVYEGLWTALGTGPGLPGRYGQSRRHGSSATEAPDGPSVSGIDGGLGPILKVDIGQRNHETRRYSIFKTKAFAYTI